MSAPTKVYLFCVNSMHYCRLRKLQRKSKIFFKGIARHFSATSQELGAVVLTLDSAAQEHMVYGQSGMLNSHPGQMRVKRVSVPTRLEKACVAIVNKYGIGNIMKEAEGLARYLHGRHAPVEEMELRQKAKEAEFKVRTQDGIDLYHLNPEEKRLVESQRKGKILNILRQSLYHWEPIEYDAYKGILYMLSRLVPEYAMLTSIFSEIQRRDSSFSPKTLFDFGSGIGSVAWAANAAWPHQIEEHFCVDRSADMNMLARLLMQGGMEDRPECFKGTFFRQVLPTSTSEKYDLVVSAFSLLELPSRKDRLEVIDLLWKKCNNYLVLAENGTDAGYKIILEARDHILKHSHLSRTDDISQLNNEQPIISNSETYHPSNASQIGHVFSPCPHDVTCPRSIDGTNTPCNFEVPYQPLSLFKRDAEIGRDMVRFSYVVLTKGARVQETWPRIVRPSIVRHRHVHCNLCTASGQLRRVTITAGKHKHLYRCAKKSDWGDSLPVKLAIAHDGNHTTVDDINNTKTDRPAAADLANDTGRGGEQS
ncbi:PREDICTED: methyltransferase-like protein 17, mitochondrial [Priapulus caudatus]|uniref:Methyltransferase-like protein 17, mitochondrial n=1 Tax=Priapulus caudatus TaxID=37621 RepID=A0ABM1EDU2_PRICU|nr:PREDICTED: methyltransferase-like protein 17, mitochondrial [Priapulus caudatus]